MSGGHQPKRNNEPMGEPPHQGSSAITSASQQLTASDHAWVWEDAAKTFEEDMAIEHFAFASVIADSYRRLARKKN